MSSYRYPIVGDGRRANAGHPYYEHLRHDPTKRPMAPTAPTARAVHAISKSPPVGGIMLPNRSSDLDRDVRDEREDAHATRDIAEPSNSNAANRHTAVPTAPHAMAIVAPTSLRHGNPEDPSLQLLSRRASDLQYEAWLNTKSVYPPPGRGHPLPQMRAGYPVATAPVTARTSQHLLGRAQRDQNVREMGILERDMRNRIANSVLGDAPLGQVAFKPRTEYRRNSFVDHRPPSMEAKETLVKKEQQATPASAVTQPTNNEQVKKPQSNDCSEVESQEKASAFTRVEREKRSAPPQDLSSPTKAGASSFSARKKQRSLPMARDKNDTGMLDLLCSATLEVGPLKDNGAAGCSCSKSHCIKLYCDCFKARRHCTDVCACANCHNTVAESGSDGILTHAIRSTLSRNPNAFVSEKERASEATPGDMVCRCVKSRCLKLYCDCFQSGSVCSISCSCVSCLNTEEESALGGKRDIAIRRCLEKRPDAFEKKVKKIGTGCACKNNRCLKKYCDCFRYNLACDSDRCSCKDCGNMGGNASIHKNVELEQIVA